MFKGVYDLIAAKAKVMVVVAHHVVRLKVPKEIQSTILDGDAIHGAAMAALVLV